MKHIYILFLFLIPLLSFNASATACDAPFTGTVGDLSWIAATERNNNDPLAQDEIGGYKIHAGNVSGAYTCSITINDGTALKHTVNILNTLDYYFVITTIDTEGRESKYSKEVFIAKDDEPPVVDDPPVVSEPPKPPSSTKGIKRKVDAPNTGGSLSIGGSLE